MIYVILFLVIFMHLKKIYLEITNGCNLNCDFCIKNKRKITNISFDNCIVLCKISPFQALEPIVFSKDLL